MIPPEGRRRDRAERVEGFCARAGSLLKERGGECARGGRCAGLGGGGLAGGLGWRLGARGGLGGVE